MRILTSNLGKINIFVTFYNKNVHSTPFQRGNSFLVQPPRSIARTGRDLKSDPANQAFILSPSAVFDSILGIGGLMITTNLNGTWTLRPNSAGIAKNAPFFKTNESTSINIPGEIHQTLLEQHIIDDPYYAMNEKDALFVGQSDWIISRKFDFHPTGHKPLLILKEVDTVSTVCLNGIEVGHTDNFFARYVFDLSGALKDGENELSFHFESAERVATERFNASATPYPASEYPGGGKHANMIRKTQASFGWDWGINLQSMGILSDVVIEESEYGFLESWNCIPRLVDHNWICRVEIGYRAHRRADLPLEVEVAGRTERAIIRVNPVLKDYSFTFVIPEEDVERWYPAGYGKQHLYPLTITFGDNTDKRMIAFRTLVVRNEKRMGGKELTIVVNDKEIFCRGANWIPADAMPGRITKTRIIRLLTSAYEANMNMIRIWGGGRYECEDFYDTCDRLGLLIWHDLMFACATYPSDEWFLKNVKEELEYQIPRLKSHPSIALWCGDNECLGAIGWYEESKSNMPKYLVNYDRLNHGLEEECIKRLDPSRTFWPSSPCGGPGEFGDNWHMAGNGDMHYWNVWHEKRPFEDYFNVKPRFCSEFGYQSFPSLSTIMTYCPEEQLNLTSPIMEFHQKNDAGNSIILENFSRYFRFPTSFEKMLYLSQAQQAKAMNMAVSYWRSLQPYCMGTIIWQLNENWPVASWSAMDYTGKWKTLMYECKKFYAPITPLSYVKDDSLYVFAANDTDEPIEPKVSVKFSTFKGEKTKQMVFRPVVEPHTVAEICRVSLKKLKRTELFAYIKLSTPNLYKETMEFLAKPRNAH
jgi:Beta-galactosidase/beta-glucuronidase